MEGAFERAHGGTLLLDEVSEMRLDLQAKLLRVLQEQEFERVGGTSPIKVDVRIIATTNRDLAAEAAAGTFRRDLYYRLGVIPILIPPLRERLEDIPLLATRFAIKCGHEMGKEVRGISPEALRLPAGAGMARQRARAAARGRARGDPLGRPDPPGARVRLRALRSHAGPRHPNAGADCRRAAGRAHRVADGGRPRRPRRPRRRAAGASSGDPGVTLTTLNVADVERTLIARALEMAGGNRTRASELLGISVRTLRNKLNTPSESAEEEQSRAEPELATRRGCFHMLTAPRAANYCRPSTASRTRADARGFACIRAVSV